jgi:hypothetical protein
MGISLNSKRMAVSAASTPAATAVFYIIVASAPLVVRLAAASQLAGSPPLQRKNALQKILFLAAKSAYSGCNRPGVFPSRPVCHVEFELADHNKEICEPAAL